MYQATFTSFTSSANPAVPGQSVTFTATMTSSAGPPAGLVDFFDLTTDLDLGSVTLSGGVSTLTTSALESLGSHAIIAKYFASSPNFAAPAPATLTHVVQSETIKGGTLFVGGSPDANTIQVQLDHSQVTVTRGDSSPAFHTALAGLTALVVYDEGNGAHIQVDNNLLLPAYLFVGTGIHTEIEGGGGPTVEVGGSGAQFQSNKGGSFQIGGYTDHNKNLTALEAALMEWASSDSYAARIASAALGIFTSAAVHSDGLAGQVIGSGGSQAQDWFLASILDEVIQGSFNDKS